MKIRDKFNRLGLEDAAQIHKQSASRGDQFCRESKEQSRFFPSMSPNGKPILNSVFRSGQFGLAFLIISIGYSTAEYNIK